MAHITLEQNNHTLHVVSDPSLYSETGWDTSIYAVTSEGGTLYMPQGVKHESRGAYMARRGESLLGLFSIGQVLKCVALSRR
jgi:hypothetical protein